MRGLRIIEQPEFVIHRLDGGYTGRISTTVGIFFDPFEQLTLGVKINNIADVANKKKYVGVLPISRESNGYVEFLVNTIEDI